MSSTVSIGVEINESCFDDFWLKNDCYAVSDQRSNKMMKTKERLVRSVDDLFVLTNRSNFIISQSNINSFIPEANAISIKPFLSLHSLGEDFDFSSNLLPVKLNKNQNEISSHEELYFPLAFEQNLAKDFTQFQLYEDFIGEIESSKMDVIFQLLRQSKQEQTSLNEILSQKTSLIQSFVEYSRKFSNMHRSNALMSNLYHFFLNQFSNVSSLSDMLNRAEIFYHNMSTIDDFEWLRIQLLTTLDHSPWVQIFRELNTCCKSSQITEKPTINRDSIFSSRLSFKNLHMETLPKSNKSSEYAQSDLQSSSFPIIDFSLIGANQIIESSVKHAKMVSALKEAILSNETVEFASNGLELHFNQIPQNLILVKHHTLSSQNTININKYTFRLLVPKSQRKLILLEQHNCCKGCGSYIEKKYLSNMRFCEYLNGFFCTVCHSNTLMFHPGLVVKTWCFKMQPVSNFAQNILSLLYEKPIIGQSEFDSRVWRETNNLQHAIELRRRYARIYCFLLLCDDATEDVSLVEKLPIHWWNSLDSWSLKDLYEVYSGLYCQRLSVALKPCFLHLTKCIRCTGRGFICMICKSNEILYPFGHQLQTVVCPTCSCCIHRQCKPNNWPETCPKCIFKSKEEERFLQRSKNELLVKRRQNFFRWPKKFKRHLFATSKGAN